MKRNRYKKEDIRLLHLALISLLLIFSLSITISAANSQEKPILTSEKKAAILETVIRELNKYYIYPEVAKKMEERYRKNLKEGKYNNVDIPEAFLEMITDDGQKISKDLHFHVIPASDNVLTDEASEEELKKFLPEVKYNNYCFQRVERLAGNIGYLKLDEFVNPKFGQAGETASSAMNFLANSSAIIIDLRENRGGSPYMVLYLLGYFFKEPTHTLTQFTRYNNKTEQYWTPAYVYGPKLYDIPLFVLQSRNTPSAAEDFSYNVKVFKKGQIVGEVSRGMANPIEIKPYPDIGINIVLPVTYPTSVVTGTSWEGTGVEPDFKVPADKALAKALLLAYEEILLKDENKTHRIEIEWAKKALKAELNPVKLNLTDLQAYTGQYGERKIYIESGNLYYQRESASPMKLVPLGGDEFLVGNLSYFRITFEKDKSGKAIKLIGNYCYNGQTYSDENSRDQ